MTVKEVKDETDPLKAVQARILGFGAPTERWIRVPHFGECPEVSQFRGK
jgi:hypothetical protein